MGRLSAAVCTLAIANVIVFLARLLAPGMSGTMVAQLAFWFPLNEHFGWWQFVSYMFMHGGYGHILFNMFALVSFGVPLERLWGARKFLVLYFLCGIGAAAIHTGVGWMEFQSIHARLVEAGVPAPEIDLMLKTGRYIGPVNDPAAQEAMVELYRIHATPMVGASGAIYGVLVAFGFLYPNARLALLFLPVPVAAKYFIPGLLALDLLSGVTGFSLMGGGIAHFAHLGGALIGALLMWHWRNQERRSGHAVGRPGGGLWRDERGY